MPQELVEIPKQQPQQEDDYQEYPKLENLDGFRFEVDVCLSRTSVSPKVRDNQAWQPSRMPALVPVAGDSNILKP